jgi:hypothetical protein
MRECREIEKAVQFYHGRRRQPTSPVPQSQKDTNMAAPLTDRLVDIRYMCAVCSMETKRVVKEEA